MGNQFIPIITSRITYRTTHSNRRRKSMRIRNYIRDGLVMCQKRDNKSEFRVGKIIRGQSDQTDIHGIVRKPHQASRHTTRATVLPKPARDTQCPLLTSSAAKRIAKILVTLPGKYLYGWLNTVTECRTGIIVSATLYSLAAFIRYLKRQPTVKY